MVKKYSPNKKNPMDGRPNSAAGADDEPPKDPGAKLHHSSVADEVEGHRHHNVYMGLPVLSHRSHRSRHHRHRHHHKHNNKDGEESNRPDENEHHHHRHHKHHHLDMQSIDEESTDGFYLTPPSQRVQFILGENEEDGDGMHESHPLFSEMETLCEMENGELEWKETARWVKFEEDVEEGGERWSKPHVSTLSLHSLFELRSLLLNGTVILDMDAFNLVQITDLLMENMVNQGFLPIEAKDPLQDALLRKHKHLYEKTKNKENGQMSRLPLIRSLAEIGRNHSSTKIEEMGLHSTRPTTAPIMSILDPPKFMRFLSVPGTNGMSRSNSSGGFLRAFSFTGGNNAHNAQTEIPMETSPSQGSITQTQSGNCLDAHEHKGNTHFMRKIPHGSEAANILVGEVNFLEKPVTAFVRLSQGASLGDITEVPVPTRFIFIMLGPRGGIARYHEIGRSMATLLSDEVFHDVAYKAKNRNHLLAGVDEFLDAVTILPPGEWDPSIRIEPPAAIPSQDSRKKIEVKEEVDEEEEEAKHREEAGLTRTGRIFGGLINDIKRKKPWYWSDYLDGFSMQSVATFFFLYFACLTPIITFGGLLGEATGNNIAAMESLVAGLICGVIYGLFSGQPLTILGSTGPVLVFETIMYDFCKSYEWDYLEFRLWIGLWSALILLLLVAVDASALVCFITRFTEENFATLIAFIFIYKAVEKVIKIGSKYPMETNVDIPKFCNCILPSGFNETTPVVESEYTTSYVANFTSEECNVYNGTMLGSGCVHYYPDVFTVSLILFFGTFLISFWLKNFKTAAFFPTRVRAFISDFAVIIAILSMSAVDYAIGIHTPKLDVPGEFKPTNPDRGWIIAPFGKNPWWSFLVALVPALLACILIFMDQQITAVIVNRKEHKLKKGGGYHLDLFILALLIAVNSVMGLPWFVAATVLSINHVNSLKVESECAAPGEKPQFLGVRENRVTHILIFVFIGLSVLMTPILSLIPMPVLFGVFLYMGFAALRGIQFFDRILIMFMPLKYQPDYAFLRKVPLKKVHLFTCIQVACLAVLWVIKSFKETSILFPLMLVVMIGVRKMLDYVFTQRELSVLDDTLPEFSRRSKIENDDDHDSDSEADKEGMMTIPLANGNVMKVPVNPINISEEMNKSGIWKDINHEGDGKPNNKKKNCSDYDETCRRCRRRSRRNSSKGSNGHANGHVILVDDDDDDAANEINFGKKRENEGLKDIPEDEIQFAKKRGQKKDAVNEDEKKRLSMMAEEEEDDETGISIKVTKPKTSI